jgi:hypothetical protein
MKTIRSRMTPLRQRMFEDLASQEQTAENLR